MIEERYNEYVSPIELKKLRACKKCHLVKSEKQFKKSGCDNCPAFGSEGFSVYEYTTSNFESIVCVMDPHKSWVSRHLNLSQFIPGSYAVNVKAQLSEELLELFGNKNAGFARNPVN